MCAIASHYLTYVSAWQTQERKQSWTNESAAGYHGLALLVAFTLRRISCESFINGSYLYSRFLEVSNASTSSLIEQIECKWFANEDRSATKNLSILSSFRFFTLSFSLIHLIGVYFIGITELYPLHAAIRSKLNSPSANNAESLNLELTIWRLLLKVFACFSSYQTDYNLNSNWFSSWWNGVKSTKVVGENLFTIQLRIDYLKQWDVSSIKRSLVCVSYNIGWNRATNTNRELRRRKYVYSRIFYLICVFSLIMYIWCLFQNVSMIFNFSSIKHRNFVTRLKFTLDILSFARVLSLRERFTPFHVFVFISSYRSFVTLW